MSNHHPGPWSVNCRQITAEETDDHMGGLVATTRPGPFPRRVKNANARIIAAAPELFEALADLVNLAAVALPKTDFDTDGELEDARAALKKAGVYDQ